MTETLAALKAGFGNDPDAMQEDPCSKFLEGAWPSIGLNGLMDLIDAFIFVATRGDDEEGDRVGLWASDYGADMFPERLAQTVADDDWRHMLGAYAVERALRGGRTGFRQRLERLIEVGATIKLGGAVLHAIVWTSMVLHGHWGDHERLWGYVLKDVCGKLAAVSPDLFVHCIHGLGHGSMIVGILAGMDREQRGAYDAMDTCARAHRGTADVFVEPHMLENAMALCDAGPTHQLQYICAGGVFMEFWKHPAPAGDAWRRTCEGVRYSAACHRFFTESEMTEQMRKAMATPNIVKRLWWRMFPPVVPEPCTQSFWSDSMQGLHLRGCIWGAAFLLYRDYDHWRHHMRARGLLLAHDQEPDGALLTLAEWCSVYAPPRLAVEVGHRPGVPARTKSYGNWLACIAGAMASVAFEVDDQFIDGSVVRQHCSQIKDPFGNMICVRSGNSRRELGASTNSSALHIWEVDVLETLDFQVN